MAYLYDEIYKKLFMDIKSGVYKEGERLPTEKELTARLGVSRVTVQTAMERLLNDGLIVRIVGKGTFVKTESLVPKGDRPAKIGLICGFSPTYGMRFFNTFEREMCKVNSTIIHKNSYNDKRLEDKAIKELIACGVDVCVIQPIVSEAYNEELFKLVLSGVPVISLDRHLKGLATSFVGTDNVSGMINAMSYASGLGHSVIGYVSGRVEDTSTLEERFSGYNQYYARTNISNDGLSLFLQSSAADYEDNNTYRLDKEKKKISDYLVKNKEITCIITAEYYIAVLLKEVLKEQNRRIPQDMSVMTFDNIFGYPDKSITSIIQNEERMANLVVEQITKLITKTGEHIKVYCDTFICDYGSVKKLI